MVPEPEVSVPTLELRFERVAGSVTTDQETGVVPTEAETIGHHPLNLHLAGHVRDVVEVAPLTRIVEVDRGRKHVGMDRQGGGDQLDPPEAPRRWPSSLLVLETCSRST